MPEYPLPKFHFLLEWGGTKVGFTEVTGLEVTTEKLEYREDENVLPLPSELGGEQ